VKLATFRVPGHGPLAGIVESGRIHAFAEDDGVREVLAGERNPDASLRDGSLGDWALGEVELLAPLLMPGTIYAVGLNYSDHAEESGETTPAEPLVFLKVSGSAAPPGGPIRRPVVVRELDYEGEMAIVIGAGGRIGGYCVADDVTARDLQARERQWTRAKGSDTFCPYGPWITTADEVPDGDNLDLKTWVNGELRQAANTREMTFGCEEVVDFISQACTLRPGDLILTGSPGGIGAALDPPQLLASGDVVRVEVESLGWIEHAVV
jgi:2-keto-4-pentenoate hydratase/2-oxohepta-3-ene-1,7-dioic acid hydratase in catechol pathway